jgi:phytoene synthase
MSALARDHLGKFEEGARALPPSLRPAYLPAALTSAYLALLSRVSGDPFKEIADISPLRRNLVMARQAFFGWR